MDKHPNLDSVTILLSQGLIDPGIELGLLHFRQTLPSEPPGNSLIFNLNIKSKAESGTKTGALLDMEGLDSIEADQKGRIFLGPERISWWISFIHSFIRLTITEGLQ